MVSDYQSPKHTLTKFKVIFRPGRCGFAVSSPALAPLIRGDMGGSGIKGLRSAFLTAPGIFMVRFCGVLTCACPPDKGGYGGSGIKGLRSAFLTAPGIFMVRFCGVLTCACPPDKGGYGGFGDKGVALCIPNRTGHLYGITVFSLKSCP